MSEINDPVLRQRILEAMGETKPTKPPEPACRVRQSHQPKLNKLETEWFNLIKDRYPNCPPVRPQAKTYVLANGVRYTPDLSCSMWPWEGESAKETCWEVKGPHAWEDALVKIKVAAHEWPEIRWVLVWKNNGRWFQQVVID